MIQVPYKVEGFLKIYDPNSLEVFVDKKKWTKIPIHDDIVKGLESHQRDVNL